MLSSMNRWPRWLQKSKPLTTQWDIEIQKTNNKQDLAHATTFQPSAKNNTYTGVWLTAIGRHATAVDRHQNLDLTLVWLVIQPRLPQLFTAQNPQGGVKNHATP